MAFLKVSVLLKKIETDISLTKTQAMLCLLQRSTFSTKTQSACFQQNSSDRVCLDSHGMVEERFWKCILQWFNPSLKVVQVKKILQITKFIGFSVLKAMTYKWWLFICHQTFFQGFLDDPFQMQIHFWKKSTVFIKLSHKLLTLSLICLSTNDNK